MVDLSTLRAPLFVPASRPERFSKAAASGADAIILDLEDAVSNEDKGAARSMLSTDFTDLPVLVRINAQGTSWHNDDLAAIAKLPIAGVMLPKSEDPEGIEHVAQACGHAVIALIESAKGLAVARSIAALPRVSRLAFGSIDFCADMGMDHIRDLLLPVRFELVLASRLAAIAAPLDGVTVQLDDSSIIHSDTLHARSLGMTGKLCIHPKQIDEVMKAFAPTDEEIEWASQVLASGDGAVAISGTMIDEPVRVRARMIIEAARNIHLPT